MNLRGIIPLKVHQINVGQLVWMIKETAEIFSVPFKSRIFTMPGMAIDEIPAGMYQVRKIIKREPDLSLPPPLQVVCEVNVHHLSWDPDVPGFNIVYNMHSEALTADKQVLVDKALFPVFRNRQEFDKANERLTECASCGNSLDIYSVNLRICRPCERILDMSEEEYEASLKKIESEIEEELDFL